MFDENIFNTFTQYFFRRIYRKKILSLFASYSQTEYKIWDDVDKIEDWLMDSTNIVAQTIQREYPWIESESEITFKYYCGYWCEKINIVLRSPSYPLEKDAIELSWGFIKKMDKEIKDRILLENIIVVRWIEYSLFVPCFSISLDKIKKGTVLRDKGFISTSLYFYYDGSYDVSERDLSQSILLVLEVPKGIKGICLSKDINDRDEFEFLISRGQCLKVKDIVYRFRHMAILIAELQNIPGT